MGAHAARRGFRVALEDRRGDRAVLADRGFEHLGGQDVADLRHDERQMQARRELAQLLVSGERHHRIMEGGVFGKIVRRLALAVVEDRPDRFGETRAGFGIVGLGGEAGGERLQLDANLEELADRAAPTGGEPARRGAANAR